MASRDGIGITEFVEIFRKESRLEFFKGLVTNTWTGKQSSILNSSTYF